MIVGLPGEDAIERGNLAVQIGELLGLHMGQVSPGSDELRRKCDRLPEILLRGRKVLEARDAPCRAHTAFVRLGLENAQPRGRALAASASLIAS